MNWYFRGLKKYAVFEGRASRKEYWMFTLFNIIIGFTLGLFEGVLGGPGVIAILYPLGVLIPSVAVSVRRLHDIDRSGWWFLVALVPLVGPIVLLVFMVQDSTPGESRYGANPKNMLLGKPKGSPKPSQLARIGSRLLVGGAATYLALKIYGLFQPSQVFSTGCRLVSAVFGAWLTWLIEPVTLTGRKLAFSPSLLFSPPLAGIVMVFLIFYGIRLTQGRGNPILDKVLYIIGGWLLVSLVYLRAVFGFAYFGRSFKFFAPSVLADMAMISIVVGIGMIFGEYMRMRGESRGKTVDFAKNAIGGEGESARMLQTIAQKKDQVVEQEVQADRQKPQGNIPLKYQGLASELKEWWRSEALEWWTRTGNSSAICDNGNESVPIHEGFLWGNRLICEDCLNGILAKYVDWPKAVTDVYKFFGSRVPNHIKLLAESLWDSPKASSSARFKMRIGSIMVSSRGVMVAGTPETNIVPNVGDTVQVVTGDGVLEAIVSKFNMLGNRYFCELDGFPPDKVKEGDILQA